MSGVIVGFMLYGLTAYVVGFAVGFALGGDADA